MQEVSWSVRDLCIVRPTGRFGLRLLPLGLVHVMNEILDMLLFIELLFCHTPGLSGESVMGSARDKCHDVATFLSSICVNI